MKGCHYCIVKRLQVAYDSEFVEENWKPFAMGCNMGAPGSPQHQDWILGASVILPIFGSATWVRPDSPGFSIATGVRQDYFPDLGLQQGLRQDCFPAVELQPGSAGNNPQNQDCNMVAPGVLPSLRIVTGTLQEFTPRIEVATGVRRLISQHRPVCQ